MNRILLVEDEPDIRFLYCEQLRSRGYHPVEAATCAEAERQLAAARPDAAVIDYRLPDGDALELLERLRRVDPDLPVVVLTAHGSVELAVEAMRRGADHFLTKTADIEPLAEILDRCFANRRAHRRRRAYDANRAHHRPDPFRGSSEAIKKLARQAKKVAATDVPTLLTGETGTGKGVLAQWLHDHGPRSEEPFVDLNCAALKPELLESELFGHEKGAFTGAVATKRGLLEVADRGTFFLDEIGEMDLAIQPKLLKALEEQQLRRLGGEHDRRIDVRLIAATHREPIRLVRKRLLRRDLYFRLNTLTLEVPPLRRRWEDVPALAVYFLDRLGRKTGRRGLALTPAAVKALVSYPWPGNVRELKNVIERAVLLADGDVLDRGDFRFDGDLGGGLDVETLELNLEELEKRQIEQVLRDEEGSVAATARRLGIQRNTLYHKLKKHGIERPGR